ncbi:hypothetical protein ACFFGH_26120 [Lysobacter korlensis]|uniref:Uncharacterized protein n=1 Tax=Lysobacter korlensis TaxID=553636 RepID=A0ABV6RWH7_9GAMM
MASARPCLRIAWEIRIAGTFDSSEITALRAYFPITSMVQQLRDAARIAAA